MSRRGNFRITTTQDGRRQFSGPRGGGIGGNYNSGGFNSRGNRGSFGKNRGRSGRLNTAAIRQFLDRDESMSDTAPSSPSYNSQHRHQPYNSNRRGGGRNQRFNNRNQPRMIRTGSAGNFHSQQRSDWFKVTIINGKHLDKNFILKSIADLANIQFTPAMFGDERSDAVFFVKGYDVSKAIQKTSRLIATPPSGSMMTVQVTQWNGNPPLVMSPDVIEKIKNLESDMIQYQHSIVMSTRYDATSLSLNLKDIMNDTDLNSVGIYVQLGRTHVARDVFDIIGTNIPQLTGLDLSNNGISNLNCLTTLPDKAPNLQRLNLSDNLIQYDKDLSVLQKLSLVELHIKGNRFNHRFKDTQACVSAMRKIFPKLLRLDEDDLPPPISFDIEAPVTLPPTKGNHFVNDNIKDLICRFVEQYFACYDNNNRQALREAYHEQARFSLCTYHRIANRKRVVFEAYNSCCRNNKTAYPDQIKNNLKTGPQDIIKLLENLPPTQHDPQSFIVDVNLTLPTVLIFVINGVFKEKTGRGDGTIRQFSRTFVTVPSGGGIAIVNDMWTITSPTDEKLKSAFSNNQAAAAVSSAPSAVSAGPTAAAAGLTQDVQLQMVKQLSVESTMNEEWSAKCLQENGWDYAKALQNFRNVHANNGVPPEAFVR